MKAANKTPKFPLIESFLAVVALGLIGFTAWYIVQTKQSTDEVLDQADRSSAKSLPTVNSALSVKVAKLPEGWQVTSRSGGLVTLKNEGATCSTTVAADQPAGQQSGRALGASQFNLQTSDGDRTVQATVSRLGSGQAAKYQSAGTLTTGNKQTNITATCNTQSDLTAAAGALQAVTVNQQYLF